MCGTFGFELDLQTVTAHDKIQFQKHIEVYLSLHHIIRFGMLFRLWNPFKSNLAAWMYVTVDQKEAVIFAFSVNSDHWSNLVPRLILRGLDAMAEYIVSEPLPNNIVQSSMVIESNVPVYQLGRVVF